MEKSIHLKCFSYIRERIGTELLSLKFKRNFLHKSGLEIGGPSDLFSSLIPIYHWADAIDQCNFSGTTFWGNFADRYHSENMIGKPGRQYIFDATDLSAINNQSYNFILASHVIEHIANPIKALFQWKEKVVENGMIVLIIPHKEGTFDHLRQVTPFDHILQDFKQDVRENDMTHLEEIIKHHDISMDPGIGSVEEFSERSKENYLNRTLHHHVFDTSLAVHLVDYIGIEILHVSTHFPFHILIIGKRSKNEQKIYEKNRKYLSLAARWRINSCFSTDRFSL